MLKARKFVEEVREIAKKYNLPFFIVTEGASGVNNNNCEAVEVARKNHINWEINNNLDPHHDWKKDENKLNNNIITIVEFRKYENEYGCNKDYFSSSYPCNIDCCVLWSVCFITVRKTIFYRGF